MDRTRRGRLYSFLQRRTNDVFLGIYSKTDGKLHSSLVRDFAINLFTRSSDLALRLLRQYYIALQAILLSLPVTAKSTREYT